MRRKNPRLLFVGVYVAATLLLFLRVPMILPTRNGEHSDDVWLWRAFSEPARERDVRATAPGNPNASFDAELLVDPVRRWDVFAGRQAILLLVGLTAYIFGFPLRRRLIAVGRWLADNFNTVAPPVYLLIAAALLLWPPCIDVETSHLLRRVERRSFAVYQPLWDRGSGTIDYGALLTEQLTLAILSGAIYLGCRAFGAKREGRK